MKNLSDIAKEMGVSKSTVSYIYHDKWRAKRISPALAAKVIAKLREGHAQPSMLGQQLRSGSTQAAGLLLPNLEQPYFLQLLSGLERRLGQEKTMLFLGNTDRGAVLRQRQTEFIEAMVARNVDRVILSPVPAEDLIEMLDRIRERGVPITFVNNYVRDYDIPFVVSDNRWGAKQLISHLLASGRRKIMFLGASPHVAVNADRLTGYQEALAEAGLEPREDFILWRELMPDDKFFQVVREHLTSRDRPDAIFFDSLFLSRKVVLMIHELGLKHPDDIVISGFDYPVEVPRTEAFRETVLKPLLTVQQAARRMGTIAAELALYGATEDSGERSIFLRPSLSWEELAPGFQLNGRSSSPAVK